MTIILSLLFQVATASASAPCSSAAYRAFDFLIGDWSVESVDGTPAGTVEVRPHSDGCALRERWRSPSGRSGTSLSAYSAENERWHQSYVDNRATFLSLEGQPVEDGMELYRGSRRGPWIDRYSWHPQSDGTLRQRWERAHGDGPWMIQYDAIWTPLEADLSAELVPMAALLGTWEVTPIQRDENDRWAERASGVLTVEPALGGKFLLEEGALDLSAGPVAYKLLLGYDPFQKTYRLSWNDSLAGLADIYEGTIVNGVLVVDNLRSRTFWTTPDGTQYAFRLEYELTVTDGERRARVYDSTDGGKTWSLYQTTVYRNLSH